MGGVMISKMVIYRHCGEAQKRMCFYPANAWVAGPEFGILPSGLVVESCVTTTIFQQIT
jgi:hypothetical protein